MIKNTTLSALENCYRVLEAVVPQQGIFGGFIRLAFVANKSLRSYTLSQPPLFPQTLRPSLALDPSASRILMELCL